MTDASTYPCPACGFLVFDEPPGSYAICEICDWEDDPVQLAYPMMGGGANRESLLECQRAILATVPVSIVEYRGIERDRSWRPLNERDCLPDPRTPIDGIGYFHAAGEVEPEYYWLRSPAGGEERRE